MKQHIKACPECNNERLRHDGDRGEIICPNCGLVLDDKIFDFGQDWRDFDNDAGNRRRAGAPLTYTQADKGLGTEVGASYDLHKLKDKNKYYRLRLWQRRVATAIERNLQIALGELGQLISHLKLSKSVEEEAARIYTISVQRGFLRGRKIEVIVPAVLYIACRNYEIPKTLEEIAAASGVSRKEIYKTIKAIVRELNLKLKPSDPALFVNKYVSRLNISPETQLKAIDLIEIAKKKQILSGKSPSGIVAGALYAAAQLMNEKIPQETIANAVGVTGVTVRNRYKEFLEELDLPIQSA
ncbi:MAG: TFIIB-type zinc ribbon-containing protein [Nanoarchaeota archaeon]